MYALRIYVNKLFYENFYPKKKKGQTCYYRVMLTNALRTLVNN